MLYKILGVSLCQTDPEKKEYNRDVSLFAIYEHTYSHTQKKFKNQINLINLLIYFANTI